MKERLNGVKVEYSRLTEDELITLASEAMLRAEIAELEVQRISQELQSRRGESVMGDPNLLDE